MVKSYHSSFRLKIYKLKAAQVHSVEVRPIRGGYLEVANKLLTKNKSVKSTQAESYQMSLFGLDLPNLAQIVERL